MTPDDYKKVLDYNPETGVFTWKVRTSIRVMPGKVAGCSQTRGRIMIRYGTKLVLAHRLAWYMTYGEWPKYEIDHINGNPADNRICNLRDVPHLDNMQNRRLARKNTSGFKGVTFSKERNKWAAQICANGKRYPLGRYETAIEAAQAYDEAALRLHGKNAVTNEFLKGRAA